MIEQEYGVAPQYQISDALWKRIVPLLPRPKPKKKAGRPRMDDRQAMTAIFYVLRTGIQWKALPRSLGAASTVHDRFQAWEAARVFRRLWQARLEAYDETRGIDWSWQALDEAMTKAPLGGERYGSESGGPGHEGSEAKPAHRRSRDSIGRYRGWCQPA